MSNPKRRVHTQERRGSRGRSLCARLAEAFRWVGIAAARPVEAEHFGLFRWPGPLNCDVEIGGAVPAHCFATKVVSFAQAHFDEADAAGFEWVGWAKP